MINENVVEEKDRPVFKVKVGSIDTAVWKQQNADGKDYFSISYSKSYLDINKEWKKTNNLHVSDIPDLQLALQKVYEFVKIRE